MAHNEDGNSIIEDEILAKFLDNAASKAKRNIEEHGTLSTEDAIPLMLKSQFNHIAHLEQQMVTKEEIKGLENKIQGLKEQFQALKDQFQALKDQFQVLKDQFQVLKDQFQVLQDQFQGLKEQFSFLKWIIGIGFVMLFALNLYIVFFK